MNRPAICVSVVSFGIIAWLCHVNGQAELRAMRAEAEARRIDGLVKQIESLQSARAYHDQLFRDGEGRERHLRQDLENALRREKVWRLEMDSWKAHAEWQAAEKWKVRRSLQWIEGWMEKGPHPSVLEDGPSPREVSQP